MYRAFGQFPDKPGLHGSEKQFALFGPFSGSIHMVENPFYLGSGKVGINNQPRLLPEFLSQSFLLQGVAILAGPTALPHDRVVDRISRLLIPDNGRLSLIGNADGRDVRRRGSDAAHGLHGYAQHACPDFVRVMLHPAGLRKILLEFPLCHAAHFSPFVEQDTPVAGGSCVQCHYILCHSFPPSGFLASICIL